MNKYALSIAIAMSALMSVAMYAIHPCAVLVGVGLDKGDVKDLINAGFINFSIDNQFQSDEIVVFKDGDSYIIGLIGKVAPDTTVYEVNKALADTSRAPSYYYKADRLGKFQNVDKIYKR